MVTQEEIQTITMTFRCVICRFFWLFLVQVQLLSRQVYGRARRPLHVHQTKTTSYLLAGLRILAIFRGYFASMSGSRLLSWLLASILKSRTAAESSSFTFRWLFNNPRIVGKQADAVGDVSMEGWQLLPVVSAGLKAVQPSALSVLPLDLASWNRRTSGPCCPGRLPRAT